LSAFPDPPSEVELCFSSFSMLSIFEAKSAAPLSFCFGFSSDSTLASVLSVEPFF